MSNPKLNLPEPVFPEHALIRDCAPVPKLSGGFKSRVMSECHTSAVRAKQTRRWKIAGWAVAVCCLGLVVCLSIPNAEQRSSNQVTQQPASVAPSTETSPSSFGMPSDSSQMAVDMPKPASNRDSEKSQMNQIIEKLKNRSEIIPADMLKF